MKRTMKRMKKLISVLVALMLLAAAGTALADGTFRMGIDPEYPPFSYLGDDGEYTGFDVEMCKGVCDILGLKQEIVPINWDTKLISLDNDEHDCIWSGMTIKPEMAEQGFVLSFPYFDNTQVVLTKEGNGISTVADLAGKKVAVQLGTSGQALLEGDQLALAQTFDGGAPILMENFNVCALELDGGGVSAVVIDVPVAKNLAAKFSGFVILDENLGDEQYAICFRKGATELCAQVQDAFMQLVENGTYLALAEKYGLDPNALCLLNQAE